MTACAFQVANLRVEVDPALLGGPAGELLRGFPAAGPGPAALHVGAAPPEAGRAAPGEAPSFFQGSLRAWRRGGAFVLRDGPATAVVSEDGRRLELAGPGGEGDLGGRAVLVGLVLALRHHGLFHLHAAALRRPGGGVLVAGPSGAGKTTLTLALASAGLESLADDAVLAYQRGGAVPSVVGIPRPFHLAPRTAAAFPALARRLGPPAPGGKRPLRAVASGGWTCAPDLLLLPEVAPGEEVTRALSVKPAAALCALLESGALLVADGMPAVGEQVTVLRAIADGVSAVRVRMGRDLLQDPGAVARAILEAWPALRSPGRPCR